MTSPAVQPSEYRAQPALGWRYLLLAGVGVGVVLLDQLTKALARDRYTSGGSFRLFGSAIEIVYARNTGAAFSLMQSRGSLFVVVAVLVIAGILIFYRRAVHAPLIVQVGLGLILGGATGNLIDRIRLGYVADLIDLHWWPVFNIADSCIVIGVATLVLASYWQDRREKDDEPRGGY